MSDDEAEVRPPPDAQPGSRHILMMSGTGFRETREWTGTVWILPGQYRSAGETPQAMARYGWVHDI
jgi:hypothetical protein